MKELLQTLDELISCGEKLIETANAIKKIFSESTNQIEPQPPETNQAEKTYSFIDVRKAFAAKSHEGYTAEVKALIEKFGAAKLSDIKEEDYPALMNELEAIG